MDSERKYSKKTSKKKKKSKTTPIIVLVVVLIIIGIIVAMMIVTSKSNQRPKSDVVISSQTNDSKTSSAVNSELKSDSESFLFVSSEDNLHEIESSVSLEDISNNDEKIKTDYIDYSVEGAAEVNEWYLLLANRSHPISDSQRPTDLTVIDEVGREIDSRIYEAYTDLLNDAACDGFDLYPISAFRPGSTQKYLFERECETVKSNHPEYTDDQVYNAAANSVAPPGTSDHELGLAVDFITDQESFAYSGEGKWLADHCSDYGFVLRYARDKCDITGVTYEPWHFRFVGIKHAKKMEELNMCLEEYVEYLKQQ